MLMHWGEGVTSFVLLYFSVGVDGLWHESVSVQGGSESVWEVVATMLSILV